MTTAEASAGSAGPDRLKPCPHSPNCVSSVSDDPSHFIDPIVYDEDRDTARKRLLSILSAMPRTRIIASDDDYIHAECRSFLFRFVDDIEFVVDQQAPLIHLRSAARMGYSDFGVNRKRVERIREAFAKDRVS